MRFYRRLAYAIGVADPVSVYVTALALRRSMGRTLGNHARQLPAYAERHYRIARLRRPIYKQTAAFGHFGRSDVNGFSWEKTNRAETLRSDAGL